MAEETKKGKTFQGTVVSDKQKDTVVVSVTRYVKHPKYKKFVKKSKKYHAHDAGNKFKMGDKITIKETKPISKLKRFKVVK